MKPKNMNKRGTVARRGRSQAAENARTYYLDWDCNTAGALSVSVGNLGIPNNVPCKIIYIFVQAASTTATPLVRGFTLYNSAGVAAAACPPSLIIQQKITHFKVNMPRSEDFAQLPSNFKVVTPNPATGGFRARLGVRVLFAPLIVFPSLAFTETTTDDGDYDYDLVEAGPSQTA